MSDVDILEKAINKAIEGGWVRKRPLPNVSPDNLAYDALDFGIPYANTIIFNHEFAKALWGEYHGQYGVSTYYLPAQAPYDDADSIEYWQFHLSNMAIAKDPIKYLGDNI